jgi:NitT/TauT family transport system substrate-binding protein
MGVASAPPLLGWAFTERAAAANADAVAGFFDASFDAKQLLKDDDSLWEKLAPEMNAAGDPALFAALRDGYRAGILNHYDPADTAAAEAAYALLAEYGGPDLVGPAPRLDTALFWKGYRR